MRDVTGYLDARVAAALTSKSKAGPKEAEAEEFLALWQKLSEFYSKRLWHQLTEVLLVLVQRPEMQKDGQLKQLYENVIADFENKLKPLSLVEIAIAIEESFGNLEESIQFIEKIGEKVKNSNEAVALTKIVKARCQLQRNDDKASIKGLIDQVGELLDEVEGVGKVHREYYKLASEFHRQQGNHTEYYHASLRFLGCSDATDQNPQESKSLAVYLSLAALLGEKVFNFGELLSHPVLDHLKGTDEEWLATMLDAFNRGNVEQFRNLKKFWSKQPDLKSNEAVLYEKICLLSLMNMTFERSSTDRQLTFADVSAKTGLHEDKVELLVMKALSGGLVRGQIDQVLQTIHVTWVQPRVLDKAQLNTLMTKIEDWSKSIGLMEKLIQDNAADILTSDI